MDAESAGKMVQDKRYDAVCSAIKGLLDAAEETFGMHSTEIAGCLGAIVGEYIACEDDHIKHDAKVMADYKAKGIDGIPNPCFDTYIANFKHSYKEHLDTHDKIREGLKEANAMLGRVCESHKTDLARDQQNGAGSHKGEK